MQLAIDFGTTNTVVSFVNNEGTVGILEMEALSRPDHPEIIPTAVFIEHAWRFFGRRQKLVVGRKALHYDPVGAGPGLNAPAVNFKKLLNGQANTPVTQHKQHIYSAKQVTVLFLKELLAEARRQGYRTTNVTITMPVDFAEIYREELQFIARELKIPPLPIYDEPLAAALGYGLDPRYGLRGRGNITLLVVDFGGGTLNLAAVSLDSAAAAQGRVGAVRAMHMVHIGGNDVNEWILDHFNLPPNNWLVMLDVIRVKEQVSLEGSARFDLNGFRKSLDRDGLENILNEKGLFENLREALTEIQQQLVATGGIDEVLLVGGSTLLPRVADVVEKLFPRRTVVRYDDTLVFTAVALGAARFAAGAAVADHIYHDYAVAVRNDLTHEIEYERIVPRQTPYPTLPEFVVQEYEDYPMQPQMIFEIFQVGRLGQVPVLWENRDGRYFWSPEPDAKQVKVERLITIVLPLQPGGQGISSRLRVSYLIDDDRMLCQTVEDKARNEVLHKERPVVRLR